MSVGGEIRRRTFRVSIPSALGSLPIGTSCPAAREGELALTGTSEPATRGGELALEREVDLPALFDELEKVTLFEV